MAFVFWGFVLLVFGGAFLVSLVFFAAGCRKKNPTLKLLGGVPLGVLVLLGMFFTWNVVAAYRPANVYQRAFGFAPASDVTSIKSDLYWFGDFGEIHLSFKASPKTIQRITGKGFKRVPVDEEGLSADDSEATSSDSSEDKTPSW